MEHKTDPIPQGKYVPATRFGDLIYTAGMTPRRNGVLLLSGKVQADRSPEFYREAVQQAAENALTAASNRLQEGEHIAQILQLTVYINAEEGFKTHPKIADLATDYLVGQLGQSGIAARAAIGMASLPEDAPVEVQLVCCAGR